MPNVIHNHQLVREDNSKYQIFSIYIFLVATSKGGLTEKEDNKIGGDVNKEVLIGGDTENNRWTFRKLRCKIR